MRSRPAPHRSTGRLVVALAVCSAGLLVVLAALARDTAPGPRSSLLAPHFYVAAADSDSVAAAQDLAALADSSLADSALADSARADTLPHVRRYLRDLYRDAPTAGFFDRPRAPLTPGLGRYWQRQIVYDDSLGTYTATEQVGDRDVRYALTQDFTTFRRTRLARDLEQNWDELITERHRERAREQSRGGLGVNIVVPGGRQSAFSTIFGKPQVDLRVHGQAQIRAGFNYQKSDQLAATTATGSQTDPEFKQDLRLGITGTIGDKLRVNVNWDTNNQFDYQNQLKLQYTGYEDEIIQNIEAGNVFLQTPSTLIRGGQSLFGIKSELQLGAIRLTTVASQEEGQSNSLSLEGGAQTTEFNLKPTGYDRNKHFFLSYYFRNRWEDAHRTATDIRTSHGFNNIQDITVWRMQSTQGQEENPDVCQAVALVDLGERGYEALLANGRTYTEQELPGTIADRYSDARILELRDSDSRPADILKSDGVLDGHDFEVGLFKKLSPNEYEIDPVLGYITLSSALSNGEALAVSFNYSTAGGQNHTVGDLPQSGASCGQTGNSDRLIVKLLRPANLATSEAAAWWLEMRNIYQLPSRGISSNEFELQIDYEPPGQAAAERLPDVSGQRTLLQMLELDRLNVNDRPEPDQKFDYIRGITINEGDGLLIFPVLEPFGTHLRTREELANPALQDRYVFDELYTEEKETAGRNSRDDIYRIRGAYKGSKPSFYDLRAYAGLIEGSVRVTSGGTPLQEGTDYSVDYQSGTVSILNDAYLTTGRDIEITYEQNSFFNLQKKTLLGARADYELDDRLAVGATVMRLTQKSPVDKYRIGEEPVSNTIWGLDGAFQAEPRWLTRAVDALPLVQTRAGSSVKVTGEIAQLRPGHSETLAFERTRRRLQDDDRDFAPDELQGISYIDGFEGFENTFSLKQPSTWRLASPPDSIGHLTERNDGIDALTTWRGTLGWYQINRNTSERFKDKPGYGTAATALVRTQAVYPSKQDQEGPSDDFIETLDLYFNPQERGPYNYTEDLPTFFNNPTQAWGGMMTRIPEGYNNFDLKNVEFVEFAFRPFAENEHNSASEDARLYVDLGTISEDVLPNGRVNGEDGLSLTDIGEGSVDDWSRPPLSRENNALDIDDATGRTEDLGLDGLASQISTNNDPNRYPAFATEAGKYADFLAALDRDPEALNDPLYRAEVAKAQYDPSGDDYHHYEEGYFDNPDYFPARPGFDRAGATIQQRFSRYFAASEMNGFNSQTTIASDPDNQVRRGNSRYPDSEDLNLNSSPDTENSYYQYEVPLNLNRLDELANNGDPEDFVIGEISNEDGIGTGWYLIRIPVQKPSRRVGSIENFNLIETMRMWTTGHEEPVTLRFATFELVGSQWRKSPDVAADLPHDQFADTSGTRLTVSSINNEEDAGTYEIPFSAVRSQNRQATGGPGAEAREQAMVLRVEDLRDGQQRAAYKTFQQGLDLLKYSNLRMFVHMHGRDDAGRDLRSLPENEQRDKVRLFVRLGSSETNDYYEYEQPLTPTELASDLSADEVWQTNQPFNGRVVDLNSMNIELAALNQLKFVRDNRERDGLARVDSLFWSDDPNACDVSCVPGLADDGTGFAPPGTRLGIKGNPSLNRINTIVVGVRNVTDRTDDPRTLNEVEVWVNELRVAGYDQSNGWAGLANMDLRLADLATVRGNFKRQTDGFGSLASTLDDRDQTDLANWSVTTDLNVDKFIPERYGWSIPVNFQVRSQTATPRFAPSRGDIRVDEIVEQIKKDESREESQRDSLVTAAVEAAQNHSTDRSFSMSVQKSRSDSKLLRNTLDGLRVSYAISDKDARDPSRQVNDSWNWRSSVDYRFSAKARTVQPFGFLGDVPVLGVLGGLDWNYIPQSLSMDATAARRFTQSQARPRTDDEVSLLPGHFVNPVNDRQTFDHDRGFQLQYNPFSFLNLNFGTDTQQTLNAVGVDTLYSLAAVRGDSANKELVTLREDLTSEEYNQLRGELLDDTTNGIGANDITRIERLDVLPTSSILGQVFNGDDGLRTERYGQRFTATYRPKLDDIKWLDWLRLQDFTYSAQYNWQNGAAGRLTGANVSNSATYKTGVTLRAQSFWRKFDWYTHLEEEQKQAKQEAERLRREREQERERRRREEEQRREQEQLQRAEEQPQDPQDAEDADGAGPEESPEAEPENSSKTEGDDDAEVEEKRGFELPLPSGRSVLRRTVLALTGMQDLTVTYSVNNSSQSTNVGRLGENGEVVDGHSLFDAFRGDAPPLGYRFGFDRRIDQDFRMLDPTLGIKVNDNLRSGHRLQGRTSLQPSDQLQINLDWSAEWDENQSYNYNYNDENTLFVDTTSGGRNQASVWAFGADYLDLVQRQLDTYLDDLDNIDDADADGRVVLTSESLVEDFRRAYTRGLGAVGSRRMMPFPMPSWTVTYSGLEKWPLLNKVAQRVTLRHGYNAAYSTDYRSYSGDPSASITLGGDVFTYAAPDFLTNSISVNESFRPLVGVDISWKGQLQTNVQWSKSNAYQLSTTSQTVSANKTQEVSVTASYSRSGLKLPILPFEAKNTIRFSLTMAHATSDNRQFIIGKVLEEASTLDNPATYDVGEAIRGDKKVSVLTSTQRLTVAPQLSYTFSQRVSADFTLRYERFNRHDLGTSVNMNGGVNVRVSISN